MDTPIEYVSFDRASGFYDATRKLPAECLKKIVDIIMQEACLQKGMLVLDAGVGTGRFARPLSKAGLHVVGGDISTKMMTRARTATPVLSLARADLRKMPFASGSFDGALVVHVLHLITGWQTVLSEIRRVLKPAGSLFVGGEKGKNLRARSIYFEVATEMGESREHIGAASFDTIFHHLNETGAEIVQVDSGRVCWNHQVRIGEMAEMMRGNPYSNMWPVPPETYARIAEEAERRLLREFGSFDAVEESPACFQLWKVTWR